MTLTRLDPTPMGCPAGLALVDGYDHGKVIQRGRRITGTKTVGATESVIYSHSEIDAALLAYGIKNISGGTVALFKTTLANAESAGFYGGRMRCDWSRLERMRADAFKCLDDVVVRNTHIRLIGSKPGAHADGNQTRRGRRQRWQRCIFELPHDSPFGYPNACMLFQTGEGPVDDILVEDCELLGGGFSIYFTDKKAGFGPPTNCRLIRPVFSRPGPGGCQYGPLIVHGNGVHVEDARWTDGTFVEPGPDAGWTNVITGNVVEGLAA